MDFMHRGALAGLTIFITVAAHADRLISPDWHSRIAQTAPPSTAAPPKTTAPPAPGASPESAVPPETAPAMGEPRQGDRWVYEQKDEITGDIKENITHTVTEVTAKELVMRVTSPGQSNSGTIVFDRNWNILENGLWKFTPNNCMGIVTPLKAGKEWGCRGVSKNAKIAGILRENTQAKVIDKQNVTVKAGSFDAFRIGFLKKEIDPEVPNRSFSVSVDMLYAPAVNHWVKSRNRIYNFGRLTSDTTFELIDYSRKP